jgi:hypothetical protein
MNIDRTMIIAKNIDEGLGNIEEIDIHDDPYETILMTI